MNDNFTLWAIRIPQEYIDKLKELKASTRIGMSEQVRTALRDYFVKIEKKNAKSSR